MEAKKSQGIVEYVLVFLFAAIIMYYFASKVDLAKIKNFAIFGIRTQNSGVISVPPMTD